MDNDYPYRLSDEAVRGRILAGAAWLDKNAPADWRQKVNLDRLQMSSGTDCVIAQVFGAYSKLMTRFNIGYAESGRLGFTDSSVVSFVRLTEAWKEYLAETQPDVKSVITQMHRELAKLNEQTALKTKQTTMRELLAGVMDLDAPITVVVS